MDELENRLTEALLPELDRASTNGWLGIFTWVQDDNSMLTKVVKGQRVRPVVADLVEEIEALRIKLREPEAEVCVWYRSACRECLEIDDHNGRGPKRLAADLAARIRAAQSQRRGTTG